MSKGSAIFRALVNDDPFPLHIQAPGMLEAAQIAVQHYRWKHDGRYVSRLHIEHAIDAGSLVVLEDLPADWRPR